MWNGRIALVNPPTSIGSAAYLAPPLGLAQVAAALERRGWGTRVDILDLALELGEGTLPVGPDLPAIATERLLAGSYNIYAFSVQCFNLPVAAAIATRLKRLAPHAKIVFGGHHAGLARDEILACLTVDDVLVQSAEQEILREDGCILPPALHKLPDLSRYRALSPHPTGLVETGRGCPFDCSYCSIPAVFGRGRTQKPVAGVMAEINAWRRAGFNAVHLVDDTFTRNVRRLEPLLVALNEIEPDFAWTAMTRADLVNPELLSRLGRSGCVGLLYGIDSGSPDALARLSKRAVHYPDIAELALWNLEAGIAPTFYFLIDLLRDTIADLETSLTQAARASIVDPGSVRLNLVRIVPGTRLAREAGGKLLTNFDAPYADTLRATVGDECDEVWSLVARYPHVFSTYFAATAPAGRAAANVLGRYGSGLIEAFPLTFFEICTARCLEPVLRGFADRVGAARNLPAEQITEALAEAVGAISEAGSEFLAYERWRASGEARCLSSRVDAARSRRAAIVGGSAIQDTLLPEPRLYRVAAA